jgi:hypothetical protein
LAIADTMASGQFIPRQPDHQREETQLWQPRAPSTWARKRDW